MPTVRNVIDEIKTGLKPVVDENELNQYILLIFNYLRSYSRTNLLLKNNDTVSENELQFVRKAIGRLKKSEPIQYVLGQTEFLGLTFKVDVRVLIPRPETEELVEWVLSEIPDKNITLLDIGTGSGCISVAIKKNSPLTEVHAWDVSADALQVAQENAQSNHVSILFEKVDILNCAAHNNAQFDVIISNPPYITTSEKTEINSNVLDYEPHLALFVHNDSNPLLFYSAIAEFAMKTLHNGGKLFFEINQAFGNEVVQLLKAQGFDDVELRSDLSGRDRMVKAAKYLQK
ncbi:MAG: peptide chain release factor N(5)-glutamine methyltransferase [Cytophagaceae bacterium]|jgi:release factor glutamine methyltransferase|nr:peptide chain release factor N(5)-glutamine methyltransferase [Cytophagaceae bacterium]